MTAASDVSLHHVGVPPVGVFFGQRGQDPCACRDTAARIITHILLIIIAMPITVITPLATREASPPPQQRAPGNPRPRLPYDGVSAAQTPRTRSDTAGPFNQRGFAPRPGDSSRVPEGLELGLGPDLFWFGAIWRSSSASSWSRSGCRSSPC